MTKAQATELARIPDPARFVTTIVKRKGRPVSYRLDIKNKLGHVFEVSDYEFAWKVKLLQEE